MTREEMKIILSKYIKSLKAYSEELEYLYIGMDKLSDEEIESKLDIIADKYSELGIVLF